MPQTNPGNRRYRRVFRFALENQFDKLAVKPAQRPVGVGNGSLSEFVGLCPKIV
jgi:hypothetical protein